MQVRKGDRQVNNNVALLINYPIHIATREIQRRKHKRKRINKKWLKRYGVIEYDLMPHGEILFNEVHRVFYMTKKTYIELIQKIGIQKTER